MTALLERPAVHAMAESEVAPESEVAIGLEVDRLVDELTRRGFLAGGLGAAALLGLDACGSSSARGPGSASSSSAASRTQTIRTKYGDITAPANPKRVVCVDVYTISALLDVGFTPVGVGDGAADVIQAKYDATYKTISKVASADDEVNVEAVAALNPDLILGVDYPYIAEVRAKLAAIAPTAIFTWDTSGDWETMATAAATAVGRASKEAALEAQYHQRARQIRTRNANLLAKAHFDLVTAGGGQAYVWLPGSGVAGVLADAGVRFASASQGPGVNAKSEDVASGFKAISYEKLDVLSDATAIITLATAGGAIDRDAKAMTRQAVFERLPAAKAGHVRAFVNFFPFSYGQALAALDELAAFLHTLQGRDGS
jgi:iron complex transport system substrate-binding protein